MTIYAVLAIAAAYFWGAIPSSYIVARWLKGIDIRDYGSGNVGATNVMTHVGMKAGFLMGTFDCVAKGTLPVLIVKLLDQGLALQVGVGLAAIAGHNWSPFIRFAGGRGVATAIGVVFGFLMWQEILILGAVLGVIGRLIFRDTGFWIFVSVLALPPLTLLFGRPPELLYMSLIIGALLIMKRLTANWEPIPVGCPLTKVLTRRLLFDRDVAKRSDWTGRRPPSNEESVSRDVGNQVLP